MTQWTACFARCSSTGSNWSHGVEAAVNVALIGRYYERFADHAVAIAQSVISIETAMKPHVGSPHVGEGGRSALDPAGR